jgi:hypothetical protein
MRFLKSLTGAGFQMSAFEKMMRNGLFGVDSIFDELMTNAIKSEKEAIRIQKNEKANSSI